MGVAISHRLPGRLRVSVDEIKYQPVLAYRLELKLKSTRGIHRIDCNANTGRALILFDEGAISFEQVLETIGLCLHSLGHSIKPVEDSSAFGSNEAVAATIEVDVMNPSSETERILQPLSRNPYFWPAAASAGLLGMLAVKRLLMGRSALATSSVSFWAAAGISVAAGYPVLRRGVESLLYRRRLTPDLMIGVATLSMAALRENLVALSVMTALHAAMYNRYKVLQTPEDTVLTPQLEYYSQRMTRIGMWLAPLSLVFTRNPLRAVGVLLAANPRPAILAHKYRWARAEQESAEKSLLVTETNGLSLLPSTKRIVLADEKVIMSREQEWQVYPLSDGADSAKAVAIAASLLQKDSGHPWRQALLQRAKAEGRSLHTPFHVEYLPEGVRGYIQDKETLLGTLPFITSFGIDDAPVELMERRMRRQGYQPQVLVSEGQILAMIGCKRSLDAKWERQLKNWHQEGYLMQTLTDAEHPSVLPSVTKEELWRGLNSGVNTVLVGQVDFPNHPRLIQTGSDQLKSLPEAIKFAQQKERVSEHDLQISRIWNTTSLALALAVPATAPLIALGGDVVGMYLISAENWRQHTQSRGQSALSGWRRWKEIWNQEWRTWILQRMRSTAPSVQKVKHASASREPWHSFNPEEVLTKLGTAEQGLTAKQAAIRLKEFGVNALAAPTPPSQLRLFLGQFKELSTVILMGTAGLSFLMGETVSGLSMLGILVLNALISTWQEKKSTDIIQALKVDDEELAKVMRDGNEQTVPVKQLVPGDLVLLEPGDKVPADIRILRSWGVEVNESTLTGESTPVEKQATELSETALLAERRNMLFMGTSITRGRCTGVVVHTGTATQIGTLDSLLHRNDEEPTYLQRKIGQVSKRFILGAFVAAGVVAIAGLLRGIPPVQMLISAVTLAASAIPEGLPLTITVALTAGVLAMSKRGAVIKKLANLESLGRVNVICSDKTGTLTKNEMTVKELATLNHRVRVSGDGYVATGSFFVFGDAETEVEVPVTTEELHGVENLLTIGMLCNNACLDESGGSEHKGDPTEIALLAAARKAGLNLSSWKRHREIPFDSDTRSMSVVCEEDEQASVVCEEEPRLRRCTVFTKGAPEEILTKCSSYSLDGQIYPMTEQVLETIQEEQLRMAEKALRVLAFAYRDLGDDEDPMEATDDNLVYAGMMGMIDPPKEGVLESIAEARELGIKPVMITGDHPLTARSIAMELGIFQPGDRILTGAELDQLSAEQLDQLIAQTSVFARVSPEHKLKIVEAYQRRGDVVAMTGDGVNDTPAMRKADVGIAMGLHGSDIAKGTAGIVLMKDHFHSIVDGVKGGRSIIGNIRKAMGCLLAGNLAEVLVTAVSIMVGLPMPLIPLQILLMNVLTDAIPAMVLATGPQDAVPKKPYKDLIDKDLYRAVLFRGIVLGLGAVGVFGTALAAGIPLAAAQTMTYASVVIGQFLELQAWRNYGEAHKKNFWQDKILVLSTLGSLTALAATIYLPPLQTVFATTPLSFTQWGMVIAMAGGLAGLSEVFIRQTTKKDSPVFKQSALIANPAI